jgi:hypothetical protein
MKTKIIQLVHIPDDLMVSTKDQESEFTFKANLLALYDDGSTAFVVYNQKGELLRVDKIPNLVDLYLINGYLR